jgi:hypothetical protein
MGPFEAYVTISERHHDEMDIVEHPVEQGARISDHAYKLPPEVVIECGWSNSPRVPAWGKGGGLIAAATGTLAGLGSFGAAQAAVITGNSPDQVRDIYNRLLKLQESVTLIDVVTGKRTYSNMLVRSIIVETDQKTEHILRATITLRQVLIATVRVVAIAAPAEDQQDPHSTLPVEDKGTKQLNPDVRTFSVRDASLSITTTTLPPLP